jgi:hypothetical protein
MMIRENNMVNTRFDWFEIAKQLKAISQAGKHFSRDSYELKRHEDIERIAAHIFEQHIENMDAIQALGILQEDAGYPTPKVDCRGVVFRDNKVLLVKEIADGGWTLPGGMVRYRFNTVGQCCPRGLGGIRL